MAIAGPILGLDMGRRMGVAIGEPGSIPLSFSVLLGTQRDGIAVQSSNLIAWLNAILAGVDPVSRRPLPKPGLVAKEEPFRLAAFRDKGVNEEAVRSAYGLHVVCVGMCERHGVPFDEAPAQTITKHFTGVARHGGRPQKKRAIILRCRQLDYVPADCTDDDRCDALAAWDWACANRAGVAPRELVLFQGKAA